MKAIRPSLAALALAAIAFDSTVALAQTAPPPGAQNADVVINMRGVEIADVADQVSRITGRTLILDPAVKGPVTVTSATPLTPDGVWELFQSVLRANGFAAIRSGRAWRIVPAANAVREGGVPTRGASGQALVTRMVRLTNVPSAEVARVVRPLVATFGSVEPLTNPNAIVVTDYADNVRRIEAIARQLDAGGGSTFASITLRNGNAPDVAQTLTTVLGDAVRVASDARSNTVIVRGTPASVAEARKIAASLDQPGGATPITRMFRLSYADSESVTNVLRGILGQQDEVSNPVARSLGQGSRLSQSGRNNRSSPISTLATNNANANNANAALGGNALAGPTPTPAATGTSSQTSSSAQGFTTPDLTIQPAPELNAIVVRGTPAAIASIESLITDLDVRRPQVMIEAAIAEITGDDAEQLGIQLGGGGAALGLRSGAATSFSNNGPSLGAILTVLGVPAGKLLGEGLTANINVTDDFSILVQALGVSTKSNLLSVPQVTVLDNSPAEIIVGQNVPFVTGSILTDSNSVTPYTTIERQDVGITLRVIPRINAGDTVRLEISQEASSIATGLSVQASDLITNTRTINTTVLADNGQTIVLGGLVSDDYLEAKRQVPILGDIPLVGELFRSRRESRTKRTLFIFLRPTIIRDSDDATAVTSSRYARLRADEMDQSRNNSLLLKPRAPRLTVEIDGIY
ncbi:type II secretion system secretin GspD [Sphingomonas sp. AOB5]|uniref:type II secretion system secretin GspD n=1 Tax=Sphingomonas sp. AOB5 TaxID=3034017 RepID=UPI0023FA2D19|nr:type II secretion system secretin GspD [Sphingomonas sp. AOB5]MDF7777933.1 type II secretion system secretin GspD [Sphingomonas sp. AOB5]